MQRGSSIKQCQSSFVFQIIKVGPGHDNIFEVKMVLSEVVDISTLKITVKSNNLRVEVHCHYSKSNDEFRMMNGNIKKHFEDFLVPEDYDGDRVEMKIEGFKVMTAALAADDILNIRLQEMKNANGTRNMNFFIPSEADARLVAVEIFGGKTIYIRAPVHQIPQE